MFRVALLSGMRARRFSLGLLALCCVVLSPSVTFGQFDSIRTVGRNVDALQVDTTFAQSANQMVSVAKITVSNPSRLSPRDRNLVVVLYVQPRSQSDSYAYRARALLAEGQKSVTVEIPHAFLAYQSAWDVGVFENGRDIENKRNRPQNQMSYHWTNSGGNSGAIAFGVIAGTSDDATKLTQAANSLATNNNLSPQTRTQVINNNFNTITTTSYVPGVGAAEVLSVSQLPTDWRAYMSRIAWYVSVNSLVEMQTTFPEAAAAFKQYVASGGAAMVLEVEAAEEFEKAVGFFCKSDARLQGWQTRKHSATVLRTETSVTTEEFAEKLKDKNYFLTRKFAAGEFSFTSASLSELKDLNENGIQVRHSGVSEAQMAYHSDGNWFWRNLISSVGKPPVWAFCVIVTLFSAILGPGLLFLTGRIQRRSLMIFFVPVISLISTLAIVAYGVLHEGFGSYTRVTSVSFIEPEEGLGFAWSRQNYFCGLPPRAGLQVPNEVFVRPVASEEDNYVGIRDPRRNVGTRIEITEDTSQWVNWLKARQQQQLLVGNLIDSPQAPVKLSASEDGLVVENVSGFDLPFFVARGSQDDYYFTTELSAGQVVTLESQERPDVSSRVGTAMVDFRPLPPPEMADGGTILDFGIARRRTSAAENSAINEVINKTLSTYMSSQLKMEPFTYATVVPENKNVFVPVEGQDDESMHFIVGAQAW